MGNIIYTILAIYFYKKIKKIDLTEKISVKALQAINEKVKELHWNE